MKKREDIEKTTEELILPIVEEKGFELVDVDFTKDGSEYYLRIYIDKVGGITLNDCETVSREFNLILDEKQYIDIPYIFEVSSPGLTRPLKKEKDFNRSIGKKVDIKLFAKEDNLSEFSATLLENREDEILVLLEDGTQKEICKNKLSLIRLAYVEEKNEQ